MHPSIGGKTQQHFGTIDAPIIHLRSLQTAFLPLPRIFRVLSLIVVVLCIVQTATTQRAHALGADTTRLVPATTAATAGAGPWLADPTLTFTFRRHSGPDDLPALVRERPGSIGKQAALAAMAQRVKEEQIFWRYSGQRASLSPWIQATRDKKHAAMTGRGQFLVLFLAFLVMSGVTTVLWRQTGSFISPKHARNRGPRRLR